MAHFEDHGIGYSPGDRRKIASALARMAAEFDLENKPDGLVNLYAALDWNPKIGRCFEVRKEALDWNQDACKVLVELADNLKGFSKEATVKLIETFDTHYGLDRLWGKRDFPDPYRSVYGHAQEKVAMEVKGMGPVNPEEIRKIAEADGLLEGIVGDDGAEMFRGDPENVFTSLPHPTQSYLLQQVRE